MVKVYYNMLIENGFMLQGNSIIYIMWLSTKNFLALVIIYLRECCEETITWRRYQTIVLYAAVKWFLVNINVLKVQLIISWWEEHSAGNIQWFNELITTRSTILLWAS